MTRQQKNKKLYKKNLLDLLLSLIMKGLKWLIKTTIKTIVYLIIGIMTIVYKLMKLFNKLIAKGFNKLPRLLKVSIVYSLVGLATIGVVSIVNPKVKVQTIVKNEIVEKAIAKEITETETTEKQVVEENKVIDLENDNANNIYNKAIENGLTKDQAILVVSISRHETGNWTSKAFHNNYNFGGIMDSDGLRDYENYDQGLNDFVRILKNYYFDLGLNTIEQIGTKYCPVGAENDPNGLNQYWVGGVTEFYNNYQESVK